MEELSISEATVIAARRKLSPFTAVTGSYYRFTRSLFTRAGEAEVQGAGLRMKGDSIESSQCWPGEITYWDNFRVVL